jgi:hypothetical protein
MFSYAILLLPENLPSPDTHCHLQALLLSAHIGFSSKSILGANDVPLIDPLFSAPIYSKVRAGGTYLYHNHQDNTELYL